MWTPDRAGRAGGERSPDARRPLEEQLRLNGMLVVALAGRNRPGFAGRLADEFPAGRNQRRSGLALQDVSPYTGIAEREGGFGSCAVEERAGVCRSIGAKPGDLKRPAIVATASNGAANDDDA